MESSLSMSFHYIESPGQASCPGMTAAHFFVKVQRDELARGGLQFMQRR